MKAISKLLKILPTIVKYAGVAMVLIETIEFFNDRLREKIGAIEPEQNADENGENVSK